MRIYAEDIKAAGMCLNYGARRWFAQNGLDFRRFMFEGMDESEAAHIDDAMMRRVLEVAHERRK